MKETILYEPIKNHFEKNGYSVQAEVKNCDIACMIDDKLVIIELKSSFNLKLIYQALDRRSFSDFIFIAIPRPSNFRKKEVRYMITILKSLNIGLITVAIDSPLQSVDIVYNPLSSKTYKNKKRSIVVNEFKKRNVSINIGGSTSRDKILTAYKEQSIYLACILKKIGNTTPAYIKNTYGIQNAQYMLNLNHYNYFNKIKRGTYTLSKVGEKMLKGTEFKEAINYYKKEVDKIV